MGGEDTELLPSTASDEPLTGAWPLNVVNDTANNFKFIVTETGNVTINGTLTQNSGFAEMLEFSEDGRGDLDEGDVLAVDPHNPRSVTRSSGARSTLVAGVHATTAGTLGSHREWDEPILELRRAWL